MEKLNAMWVESERMLWYADGLANCASIQANACNGGVKRRGVEFRSRPESTKSEGPAVDTAAAYLPLPGQPIR